MLKKISQERFIPIRDEVFNLLKNSILKGKLKPGERLVESEIADKLGVSRTPVREALRKLEIEDLVHYVPHKGTIVKEISKEEIDEIFQIRSVLEGLNARMAAERITYDELLKFREVLTKSEKAVEQMDVEKILESYDEFNQILYNASKSKRLQNMIVNLKDLVERFRHSNLLKPERPKKALDEHKQIFEAIANRNGDLAEKLTRKHIKCSKKTFENI